MRTAKNLLQKAKQALTVALWHVRALGMAPRHARAALVRILADALLLARQEHEELLAWEQSQPTAAQREAAAAAAKEQRRQEAISRMGVAERAARGVPLPIARTPEQDARFAEFEMWEANKGNYFASGPEMLALRERIKARYVQARRLLLLSWVPEIVSAETGLPLDAIVQMHAKIFRLPAKAEKGADDGE